MVLIQLMVISHLGRRGPERASRVIKITQQRWKENSHCFPSLLLHPSLSHISVPPHSLCQSPSTLAPFFSSSPNCVAASLHSAGDWKLGLIQWGWVLLRTKKLALPWLFSMSPGCPAYLRRLISILVWNLAVFQADHPKWNVLQPGSCSVAFFFFF